MDSEEKLLGFVGAVSERAGALTSRVVGIGGKIAGVASDGISAGKEIVGLADDKEKDKGKKKSDSARTAKPKYEPVSVQEKQKPTKVEKKQSRLESQINKLKVENKSLMSELDQMRSELNETRSRESAVRARAAALESELETANHRLEQIQNKAAKTKEQKQASDSVAKLESELAAAKSKLKETRGEAKEIHNQLKSQLKEMRAEKESLLTELEIAQKDSGEIETREKILTEEITALETKLAAAQKELSETKSQAEKTHAELSSQIEALQAEKESLFSELKNSRKNSGQISSRENILAEQISELESELSATQRELSKTRSRSEKEYSEFMSQIKDLQAEKESLISDVEKMQKQVEDERMQAHSMEAQMASLKAEIETFKLESEIIPEKEPGIDTDEAEPDEQINVDVQEQPSMHSIPEDKISTPVDYGLQQTGYREKLPTPTVEEIGPSVKAAADDEELTVGNVENVEKENEPVIESRADLETKKTEPELMPEIEVAEILEVTVEEVQAAEFKNEDEKALFRKAFSDFSSLEATLRANAAGVVAGIRHELSLRLLISHMANEPSVMVRQKCIEAISKLKMKEGVSAIECALDDKAASVRLAAVWGLYRLAGAESIPKLITMLYDGDVAVRRRAITCIGWVGGQITMAGAHHRPRVISALIRCLNDPVESVRNAALNTLQSVTGKKMPASQNSPERLIGQWKRWWKAELSG